MSAEAIARLRESDDVKGFRERITAAMERIAAGHSPMRIPADMTDPDIVLSDCLARIDGEYARTAAAVAAAREEQRETCAAVIWAKSQCATASELGEISSHVRAAPLTATPLADRIAELEARLAEWAEKDGNSPGYNLEKAKTYGRIAGEERKRAEKAEAERDALRAQVADLEAYKQEGDEVEIAAQRLKFWADNPHACPVHFGARTACGQCYDSERSLYKASMAEASKTIERLTAQVEAARALCASFDRGGGLMWPGEVLAAMDGAKP